MPKSLLIFIAVLTVLTTGCRLSNQTVTAKAPQVVLMAPLFPPAIGPGTVKVKVVDQAGEPLDNLVLNFKGDMTHAGMVPVLASASTSEEGIYEVPFEWSMAGDWVLTVSGIVDDRPYFQERFELFVDGNLPICSDPSSESSTIQKEASKQ